MAKWIEKMKALVKDEEGATAIEYGLMVAGISAVIAAAVFLLGGSINTFFGTVDTKLIQESTAKVNEVTTATTK